MALTIAVGRLLTLRGGRPADLLVPAVVVVCVVGYALVARGVPATPRHGDRPAPREMLALLRDRRLWVLLGPAALHWAACAPYHVFFGVLVRDLGLPDDVTSAGMAIGVVAEILALLAFPRLERRFPLRALLAVAMLGSALRWALLSRATQPAVVAGLQAMHGLTFGLFWGSAMRALVGRGPDPAPRDGTGGLHGGRVRRRERGRVRALRGRLRPARRRGAALRVGGGARVVALAALLASSPRARRAGRPSGGP